MQAFYHSLDDSVVIALRPLNILPLHLFLGNLYGLQRYFYKGFHCRGVLGQIDNAIVWQLMVSGCELL